MTKRNSRFGLCLARGDKPSKRSRPLWFVLFGLAGALASATAHGPLYAGNDAAPNSCAASGARDVFLSGYLPVEGAKPVVTTAFQGPGAKHHSITHWRGRAVVLNFWATWCPPCVKELPALARMKRRLANRGIDVIAVNEDKNNASDVAAFLTEVKAQDLEPYFDPGRSFMKAARIASLPTTLLINTEGHEVAAVLQDAVWDDPEIVEFIAGCLGHQPTDPDTKKPAAVQTVD